MAIRNESFMSAPQASFSSTTHANETGRAGSVQFDVPARATVANPNRTRL